jgi:scyllo-inositol 2-dehydrogenase (NADP+)
MGISHLAMLNALPNFKVIAVCDSAGLVGGVIEKYARLPYISDFNGVLRLSGLDAILIATPTVTHEVMVRKALECGLHVFCEKPLTLSSGMSESLARLAQSNKLVSQVGYHNRFIGTFAEVKRLVSAGALGRSSHVLAEAYGPVVLRPTKPTWRGKSGQGGGCLYDYAAHPLNLVNWYFGRPETCNGSVLKSGFSAEVDDEVYASITFAEGLTGQLSVNWSDASVRKMTTRISIWGEGGRIYADRQEIQVFLTGNAPMPEGYSAGWTVKYMTELTQPVSFYLRGEEYTAQLEAFGRAIVDPTAPRENSFGSSADTDATIEMIRGAAAVADSLDTFVPPPQSRRASGLLGRMLGR